jgi:hypothetical protein
VAFADPSGLVTVDLRDNAFQRFELPVREAVALTWAPDARSLLLKDRHDRRRPCGPRGCRLDVSSGRLTPVPFDLFRSTYDPSGAVVEIRATGRQDAGRVVTHHVDGSSTSVALRAATTVGTAGGPAAARDVAFARCRRPSGVMVVDRASGAVVSTLTDPHRRGCRLGAQAWLGDDHLVVADWQAGDLWLWDVRRGRVRRLAEGGTRGVQYEVAGAVLAERFLSRRHEDCTGSGGTVCTRGSRASHCGRLPLC